MASTTDGAARAALLACVFFACGPSGARTGDVTPPAGGDAGPADGGRAGSGGNGAAGQGGGGGQGGGAVVLPDAAADAPGVDAAPPPPQTDAAAASDAAPAPKLDTAPPPAPMDTAPPPKTDTMTVVIMDTAPPPKMDTAPASPVPTAGLVGYWPFDGSSAKDASGNGNDGALMGGAGWTTGKRGGAVALGTSKYVQVADSASVDSITGAFTIGAWVLHTSTGGATLHTIASRQQGDTHLERYAVFLQKGGGVFDIGSVDGGVELTYNLPLNTWTHVAVTYDGATVRLYVNGAEAGAKPLAMILGADSTPLVIGGNLNGPSDPDKLAWEGALDEVVIYNRALAAAEVSALAK